VFRQYELSRDNYDFYSEFVKSIDRIRSATTTPISHINNKHRADKERNDKPYLIRMAKPQKGKFICIDMKKWLGLAYEQTSIRLLPNKIELQ